jgi:predicted nucleotidyltransferase
MSRCLGQLSIKMGQEIIELFFEHPNKEFQIRGIAKSLKFPKSNVEREIANLIGQGIVIKRKGNVFPYFIADESNQFYKFHKREYVLKKILQSGLVDYLEENLRPKCIILFGSFAKAEYTDASDIDLFVQSEDSKINLDIFEKRLKHKINILFETNLNKLSPELFNNILNGNILKGFIKIK